MPRKAKHGKPLLRRSISIREDQADFLDTLDNVSEFVRRAIDGQIAKYEALDDPAIVVQRMDILNREASEILEGAEYNRVVKSAKLKEFIEYIAGLDKIEVHCKYRVYLRRKDKKESYQLWFFKAVDFRAFLHGRSVERKGEAYRIDGANFEEFCRLSKFYYGVDVRLLESFDKRLAEIAALKESIMSKVIDSG